MCVLVAHHCDKYPSEIVGKEERFILTHGLKVFSPRSAELTAFV